MVRAVQMVGCKSYGGEVGRRRRGGEEEERWGGGRVISYQVSQHMHLMFQILFNLSIYIGLHMSLHFPILYVHNLNGCRITQH